MANGASYWLRPSFIFSYMTGTVDQLAYPLLLAAHGVPPWLLTIGFGHSDMYWYRVIERLGRNSLVGTTVHDSAQLPEHLAMVRGQTEFQVNLKLGLTPCPVSEILGRAGAVTNTETDDMEIAGKAITIPKGTDTESVVVLPTATVVAVLQCEDALPSGSGPIQRELLRHYAIGQVFGMVRGQNGKGSEW